MEKNTVLVAMSGGVDSSTAAALLLEQGYRVAGVTMFLWPESEHGSAEGPCQTANLRDAEAVCRKLGIEHHTVDLSAEFMSEVVNPFIGAYLEGRTPNPCILCNQRMKFSHLVRKAQTLGADILATGHYARIIGDGPWKLARGKDILKDQSYFLFTLGQEELQHLIFPLGNMTKEQVRRKAREFNIPVHDKSESQDICFIKQTGLREFITQRIRDLPGPGSILDMNGSEIGTHEGSCFYTIGQRKGLGIASGEPLYVVRIDAVANTVTLGTRKQALSSGLIFKSPHWVAGDSPEFPFRSQVQIRHRHAPADCMVRYGPENAIRVLFQQPQHGVAPGQAAVLYDGDVVLGGGWIEGGIQDPESGPAS